jgi:hypothetical protein
VDYGSKESNVYIIAEYMKCSLSYRFSRIDKLRPEFKSDNMEFGSCIHKALADFHQERMMGTILTSDQLLERFIYHWTIQASENDEIKYRPENSFNSLLEQGKALLEVYHESFNDQNMTIRRSMDFWWLRLLHGIPRHPALPGPGTLGRSVPAPLRS